MVHNIAHQSTRCMVVTVSDTRTKETDKSGDLIRRMLEEAHHLPSQSILIPDDKLTIERTVQEGIRDEAIDVILLNGGTGISQRDVTIEILQGMFEKELTGFGELFRLLSYQVDIGSKALLSRATAGTIKRTAVFAMPGSVGAVKLALSRLIIPELSHVVYELHKDC